PEPPESEQANQTSETSMRKRLHTPKTPPKNDPTTYGFDMNRNLAPPFRKHVHRSHPLAHPGPPPSPRPHRHGPVVSLRPGGVGDGDDERLGSPQRTPPPRRLWQPHGHLAIGPLDEYLCRAQGLGA